MSKSRMDGPGSQDRATLAVLVALALIGAPCTWCLNAAAVNMAANEIRLWSFSRNLFDFPLPPATREIARHAQVGLLQGNGNHCDFSATMELSSELERDEIMRFYERVRLPAAHGPEHYALAPEVRVRVDFEDTRETTGEIRFSIWDIGYSACLDFRCG